MMIRAKMQTKRHYCLLSFSILGPGLRPRRKTDFEIDVAVIDSQGLLYYRKDILYTFIMCVNNLCIYDNMSISN